MTKKILSNYASVAHDFENFKNFGISRNSKGGKVTNRILNTYPTYAKNFFGVYPVDSAPPMSGSFDPKYPSIYHLLFVL